MALEIERKFLVTEGAWRDEKGTHYRQGYLNSAKQRTVRVRIIDNSAYLTVKGISKGAVRDEYEFEIPLADAEAMLNDLCERPFIEKKRYRCEFQGLVWEVDEFFAENQGLIVAEVELESEDQQIVKPDWVTEEVTNRPEYYNANLIHHPYCRW